MKKIPPLSLLTALLFIAVSTSFSSGITQLWTETLDDEGVHIRDVAFDGRHYYLLDSGNGRILRRTSGSNPVFEQLCESLSDPRAMVFVQGLNSLLVSDRNYNGERSLLILDLGSGRLGRVGGNSGLPESSPDRLFNGWNEERLSRATVFSSTYLTPALSDEGFGYRVSRMELSRYHDGSYNCAIQVLIDTSLVIRDVFSFISSIPRIAAVSHAGRNNLPVVIQLAPSSVDYTVKLLDSDSPLFAPDWDLNPARDWCLPVERNDTLELENLRQLVSVDPLYIWRPDSLPEDYRYRRITEELGSEGTHLLVLRTTGSNPVIDVYDLTGSGNRSLSAPLELSGSSVFPPQEALEGYWQYRIADRRLIAFNRNTIYVFEIKSL